MKFQTLKIVEIPLVQGRWRSNLQTRCRLPLAMCLPSFIAITKTDLEISETKCYFRPLKWPPFPDVKVLWGRIRRKGALTPSNVPTKFCWNNQNTLRKSAKMWFQTFKMAAIYQGQGRLMLNSRGRCPLPLSMSLLSFGGLNKIDLDKSAKMWFQTLELAAIWQGHDRLRSNSRTRCPLTLAMSPPSFVGITKIHWKKSAKCYFRPLKWLQFPKIKVVWGQIPRKGVPQP